jgi:hypothetical protein
MHEPTGTGGRFIWLNPVIGKRAGERHPELLAAVAERGYTVVTCRDRMCAQKKGR